MNMSPKQLKRALILTAGLFGVYALTVELSAGGNPLSGITIAAGMVMVIVSAILSDSRSADDRDTKR